MRTVLEVRRVEYVARVCGTRASHHRAGLIFGREKLERRLDKRRFFEAE